MRPTLYGPNGQDLQANHAAAKKACVEAWVASALAGDAAMGRSAANFAQDPAAEMKPHLAALKERDIAVYVGSGNLILADLKPAAPLILQRRPLAQRYVVLDLGGA